MYVVEFRLSTMLVGFSLAGSRPSPKPPMSRLSLGLAALLGLLAVSAAAPAPAEAQFTIKRSVLAQNSHDLAVEAARQEVSESVNAIFLAQRRYFGEHARFAPELWELPDLADQPLQVVSYSAGRDWYVVLAGSMESGLVQTVVTVVEPAASMVATADGRDR